MIHILFGPSPAASLKVALNDLGIDKQSVISFWDMFSVGPISKLHEEVGKENRFEWVKNIWDGGYDDYQEYKIRFQQAINQIKAIPNGELITIWVGDNSHEQTGLRYALHLLKDKDIDIITINTTKSHNELFKKKKIIYTILHTGEISPEKLQSIYKQSKHEPPLTQHEREDCEKEWLSLSDSQETLRIWRNGRMHSVTENYYDEFIITRARKLHGKEKTSGFMKSARLIGDVMGHLDQYVGDAFLEYRLKKLIEAGVFDAEGSLEAMRFYSVRLRS
ncbi:DUF1835 domain-containing protein [Ammoniphilus sp. 3BR4]|uniref:DUF1835 domain-containing protein n=1 Tax=Ammoniphilus sp. 3BR4 TaxID=3158265 RepID=UPI003465D149